MALFHKLKYFIAKNSNHKWGVDCLEIHEFNVVLLKDGRDAAIVEVFDSTHFLADVGDSPADWDTIPITRDDIQNVIYHEPGEDD